MIIKLNSLYLPTLSLLGRPYQVSKKRGGCKNHLANSHQVDNIQKNQSTVNEKLRIRYISKTNLETT